MLLPQDLQLIFQLVGRSTVAIQDITNVMPSLQRLEAAVRSGLPHIPVSAETPDVEGVSPGGTA